MDRRRSKRKNVHINAVLNPGSDDLPVTIENISELGIYIETNSANLLEDTKEFSPGDIFEVEFTDNKGHTLRLRCKVIWSYNQAPDGLKRETGMEIIFPPPVYLDFYNSIE